MWDVVPQLHRDSNTLSVEATIEPGGDSVVSFSSLSHGMYHCEKSTPILSIK